MQHSDLSFAIPLRCPLCVCLPFTDDRNALTTRETRTRRARAFRACRETMNACLVPREGRENGRFVDVQMDILSAIVAVRLFCGRIVMMLEVMKIGIMLRLQRQAASKTTWKMAEKNVRISIMHSSASLLQLISALRRYLYSTPEKEPPCPLPFCSIAIGIKSEKPVCKPRDQPMVLSHY